MRKGNTIIIVLLSILLIVSLAFGGYYFYQSRNIATPTPTLPSEQGNLPLPTIDPKSQYIKPGWKTYNTITEQFHFDLPTDVLKVEEKDYGLAFKDAQSNEFAFSATFAQDYSMDNGSSKNLSFEQFVLEKMKYICDADGPMGMSLRCDKVVSNKMFQNKNGINVMEIYLNQVQKSQGKTTNTTVGPFYAVDLHGIYPTTDRNTLIWNLSDSETSKKFAPTAREIIETLGKNAPLNPNKP